jgi:hypothetical protein
MSDLVPLSGGELESRVASRPVLPGRIERATERAVAMEQARAIVGAARVQAVTYVTSTALLALSMLEDEETAAVARDPMNGGRRQRALVDGAMAQFRQTINDVGRSL